MKSLSTIPTSVWRLLFAAALIAVLFLTEARAAECPCVSAESVSAESHVAAPQADSWIFARSRYSHDPDTGGRVAQYAMKPAIEPLPDPRAVTSGYNRTRTILRGADGSVNTRYQVQSYGNGRGGMDAEWERFHDAWRGSTIGGGNFQTFPQQFGFGGGFGGGFPGFGYGGFYPPWLNQPGFRNRQGFGPGTGRPDAGRLDPDGADGYHDGRRRTPDRRFFNQAVPSPADLAP